MGHLFLSPSADGKQRTPRKRQSKKVEDTWVHESLEGESCSLARNIHVVLLNGLLFNLSVLSDSVWHHWHQVSMSFATSRCLFKLMSIELMMPPNHLIFCCPLLLLPLIFPSMRVFSNELALHIRWPKDRSFSISPCNEYSGLISFRTDWFDLLAVQGTLKSLLQHYSSKASILWPSAFFMANSYIHTWLLEKP